MGLLQSVRSRFSNTMVSMNEVSWLPEYTESSDCSIFPDDNTGTYGAGIVKEWFTEQETSFSHRWAPQSPWRMFGMCWRRPESTITNVRSWWKISCNTGWNESFDISEAYWNNATVNVYYIQRNIVCNIYFCGIFFIYFLARCFSLSRNGWLIYCHFNTLY